MSLRVLQRCPSDEGKVSVGNEVVFKDQTGNIRNSQLKAAGTVGHLANRSTHTLPGSILFQMFQVPCGPNKSDLRGPDTAHMGLRPLQGDGGPKKHFKSDGWDRQAEICISARLFWKQGRQKMRRGYSSSSLQQEELGNSSHR